MSSPDVPVLCLEDARALETPGADRTAEACQMAAAVRDEHWGKRLTYSPKVFLPLTNLCRSFCGYCSFRRSPGQAGEWTMTPDEVMTWLRRGAAHGAVEALLCLGDHPETQYPSYRDLLGSWGFASTGEYLVWASEQALATGLFPHTNAGLLDEAQMLTLKATNVSLGLMLESSSERLCEPGGPHEFAPDKRPRLRLAMMEAAGRLRIPFTTGILIGIGETPLERLESLFAIRALHERFGHIQEVIVQNFTARPRMPLRSQPEPDLLDLRHTVALARLILPPEVSVQAPPNLNPKRTAALVQAGVNDFGGISPVSPDYINPSHPWPEVQALERECESLGFALRPRLPVYQKFVSSDAYLPVNLKEEAQQKARALSACESAWDLPPVQARASGGAPSSEAEGSAHAL